jgi:uncharacterized protein YecT (DUF1311 family)
MTAPAQLLAAHPLAATRLALAACLLAALPLPALAAPPSFDCATAKAAVERAICRSATLSAFDVEIAAAYERAMSATSDAMRETVRDAQAIFLEARDDAYGLPGDDLEQRLADQIALLKSIETRGRTTLEGAWRNGFGGIDVTLGPDGAAEVTIGTADPSRGGWLCDVSGTAQRTIDGWVIGGDVGGPLGGWRITLTLGGGRLTATTSPPPDVPEDEPPPFCDPGGSIDGAFLPVRPQIDWGP